MNPPHGRSQLTEARHPSIHKYTFTRRKKKSFGGAKPAAGKMQTAKVKAKDMVSSAKEKVKEGTANVQGKTGEATAKTHGEKEMAKEGEQARKAQANAEKHQEKAEHRADAAAGRHGTRVPLTGTAGTHGHHGPVGAPVDPEYPGTGAYPATEKYI